MLAGPDGAGKSTLFEVRIKARHPRAEFVNADLLAKEHFGHNAATLQESGVGQQLAEERRKQFMAAGKDIITESTFSHPSKLDLLSQARQAGYKIIVHHVNVRSADISVARVSDRVADGGDPVPEDKIRERYQRNQQLIKQAVTQADNATVWDNSKPGQYPTRVFTLERGVVSWASNVVPTWAQTLYEKELAHIPRERLNPASASFAEAKSIVSRLDPAGALYVAREGVYRGKVIAETAKHLVQQLDRAQGASKAAGSYVAHFKRNLERIPEIGRLVAIKHVVGQVSRVIEQTPEQKQAAINASLAAAQKVALEIGGEKATASPAEAGKKYRGPVLGETSLHVVQGGSSPGKFVAHQKESLASVPSVGNIVQIAYSADSQTKASVADFRASDKDHSQYREPDLDR